MSAVQMRERIGTIVIGGGQAGLSVGYHLKQRGVPFVILDASERIGDSWRNRWDSLRLFSPARFDGLAGMRFPGDRNEFPTKDQMADYLEAYARRFALPVRSGTRVDRVWKDGDRFMVSAGSTLFEADQVVVAMSGYQVPKTPDFAASISPEITQLHSRDYRSPAQLRDGGVLVVGFGNSGAEIAKDLVRAGHPTWISGSAPGQMPFDSESVVGRHLILPVLFRVVFHRLLTLDTPIGRRARAGSQGHATPLIRVKTKTVDAAGIQRVPRTVGTRNGKPMLDDGRVLDVANIIWCTGYHPGFSWIDLPIFDEHGEPAHERGRATGVPGLWFVGLHFLYAMSSAMIHGVGRDAERVANAIADAQPVRRAASAESERVAVVA